MEFELEEQIIIGGLSSKIRKQALRNPNFKLADMLIEGRRDEQSKFQATDIESKEVKIAETNQVSKSYRVNTEKKPTAKCRNCGGAYPHTGPCPARGKQCYKCSKLNHFASVYQGKRNSTKFTHASKTNTRSKYKKTVHPLTHDTDSSTEDDYLYAAKRHDVVSTTVNITVCNHKFPVTIDTGATINVINYETFAQLQGVKLQQTNIKAYAYNAIKPVRFPGEVCCPC